jgi:hypothetical protein
MEMRAGSVVIAEEHDPLGPVVTMAAPSVTFGARAAALAGDAGFLDSGLTMTDHITCTSVLTLAVHEEQD